MPLPFIEPTFVMALLAGLIFSFPVGSWLQRFSLHLFGGRPALRLSGQALYDVGMLTLLILSIAAVAASSFTPGIYAKF